LPPFSPNPPTHPKTNSTTRDALLPGGGRLPDITVEAYRGSTLLWRKPLASVDDDMESRFLRASRASFSFALKCPGREDPVEGVLWYFPYENDAETVPVDARAQRRMQLTSTLQQQQQAQGSGGGAAAGAAAAAGAHALTQAGMMALTQAPPAFDEAAVAQQLHHNPMLPTQYGGGGHAAGGNSNGGLAGPNGANPDASAAAAAAAAVGAAPIFEAFWQGRLIPGACVDTVPVLEAVRARRTAAMRDAVPDAALGRVRGALFFGPSFRVTRNKLMFRDNLPQLLAQAQPLERNLERKLREWLAQCHRSLDRSVRYERLLGQAAQAAARRELGEAVTVFERVHDGVQAISRGDAVRLATKPPILGRVQFFSVGQVVREEGCYGNGRVTVSALPEAVFGRDNRHTWPLRRIEALATERELAEHASRELAKLPAALRVEPLRLAGGGGAAGGGAAAPPLALRAGATLPEASVTVVNCLGARLTRSYFDGQKHALRVTQTLYYLGPLPEDEEQQQQQADEAAVMAVDEAAAAPAAAAGGKTKRGSKRAAAEAAASAEAAAAAEAAEAAAEVAAAAGAGGGKRRRQKAAAAAAAEEPGAAELMVVDEQEEQQQQQEESGDKENDGGKAGKGGKGKKGRQQQQAQQQQQQQQLAAVAEGDEEAAAATAGGDANPTTSTTNNNNTIVVPADTEVVLSCENRTPIQETFHFQRLAGGLTRAGRYVLQFALAPALPAGAPAVGGGSESGAVVSAVAIVVSAGSPASFELSGEARAQAASRPVLLGEALPPLSLAFQDGLGNAVVAAAGAGGKAAAAATAKAAPLATLTSPGAGRPSADASGSSSSSLLPDPRAVSLELLTASVDEGGALAPGLRAEGEVGVAPGGHGLVVQGLRVVGDADAAGAAADGGLELFRAAAAAAGASVPEQQRGGGLSDEAGAAAGAASRRLHPVAPVALFLAVHVPGLPPQGFPLRVLPGAPRSVVLLPAGGGSAAAGDGSATAAADDNDDPFTYPPPSAMVPESVPGSLVADTQQQQQQQQQQQAAAALASASSVPTLAASSGGALPRFCVRVLDAWGNPTRPSRELPFVVRSASLATDPRACEFDVDDRGVATVTGLVAQRPASEVAAAAAAGGGGGAGGQAEAPTDAASSAERLYALTLWPHLQLPGVVVAAPEAEKGLAAPPAALNPAAAGEALAAALQPLLLAAPTAPLRLGLRLSPSTAPATLLLLRDGVPLSTRPGASADGAPCPVWLLPSVAAGEEVTGLALRCLDEAGRPAGGGSVNGNGSGGARGKLQASWARGQADATLGDGSDLALPPLPAPTTAGGEPTQHWVRFVGSKRSRWPDLCLELGVELTVRPGPPCSWSVALVRYPQQEDERAAQAARAAVAAQAAQAATSSRRGGGGKAAEAAAAAAAAAAAVAAAQEDGDGADDGDVRCGVPFYLEIEALDAHNNRVPLSPPWAVEDGAAAEAAEEKEGEQQEEEQPEEAAAAAAEGEGRKRRRAATQQQQQQQAPPARKKGAAAAGNSSKAAAQAARDAAVERARRALRRLPTPEVEAFYAPDPEDGADAAGGGAGGDGGGNNNNTSVALRSRALVANPSAWAYRWDNTQGGADVCIAKIWLAGPCPAPIRLKVRDRAGAAGASLLAEDELPLGLRPGKAAALLFDAPAEIETGTRGGLGDLRVRCVDGWGNLVESAAIEVALAGTALPAPPSGGGAGDAAAVAEAAAAASTAVGAKVAASGSNRAKMRGGVAVLRGVRVTADGGAGGGGGGGGAASAATTGRFVLQASSVSRKVPLRDASVVVKVTAQNFVTDVALRGAGGGGAAEGSHDAAAATALPALRAGSPLAGVRVELCTEDGRPLPLEAALQALSVSAQGPDPRSPPLALEMDEDASRAATEELLRARGSGAAAGASCAFVFRSPIAGGDGGDGAPSSSSPLTAAGEWLLTAEYCESRPALAAALPRGERALRSASLPLRVLPGPAVAVSLDTRGGGGNSGGGQHAAGDDAAPPALPSAAGGSSVSLDVAVSNGSVDSERRVLRGAAAQLRDAHGNAVAEEGVPLRWRFGPWPAAGGGGGDGAGDGEGGANPPPPGAEVPELSCSDVPTFKATTDARGRVFFGDVDVVEGTGKAGGGAEGGGGGGVPDALACLLRLQAKLPAAAAAAEQQAAAADAPPTTTKPSLKYMTVWSARLLFSDDAARYGALKALAAERDTLKARLAELRDRGRAARGRADEARRGHRAAAKSAHRQARAVAAALGAGAGAAAAGGAGAPDTAADARALASRLRADAQAAAARPEVACRYGLSRNPLTLAIDQCLAMGDPDLVGAYAQLGTVEDPRLAEVVSAAYCTTLQTLVVASYEGVERLRERLRKAGSAAVPSMLPLTMVQGFSAEPEARAYAAGGAAAERRAGALYHSLLRDACGAGRADAPLPMALPHTRALLAAGSGGNGGGGNGNNNNNPPSARPPPRGPDGRPAGPAADEWPEGCLGYVVNLIRPARRGTRATLLYSQLGRSLVFEALPQAAAYRRYVTQSLRGSVGDVLTLDGGKLSGRGVVLGTGFRVPPLAQAAVRFGTAPRNGGGGGEGGEEGAAEGEAEGGAAQELVAAVEALAAALDERAAAEQAMREAEDEAATGGGEGGGDDEAALRAELDALEARMAEAQPGGGGGGRRGGAGGGQQPAAAAAQKGGGRRGRTQQPPAAQDDEETPQEQQQLAAPPPPAAAARKGKKGGR
jgi:hypothetical protein